MSHPLVVDLRRELRRRADPTKAPAMQAYMKSAMPYWGVMTTPLRELCRELFPRYPLRDFDEWREVVLEIWRDARRREERYAAIALTGHPAYTVHQKMKSLPIYEEMIVTGAWWDYVDGIASGRLGALLRAYPASMKARMRAWSRDRDLWKRRSSILCQLGFKGETDLRLLYDCIEPNLEDKAFFIRKAIGWALRQQAWTDPEEVARAVERFGPRLSPLSRREALKNLATPVDRNMARPLP
jgi:3-methyladenine DNA glycosylase AlkD